MGKKTIYEISNTNLSNMTVKQLKSYIKEASSKVVKDLNSRYKAVNQSARYIAETIGMKRRKNILTGKMTTRLVQGFKGMKKSDLLKRARLLQGHAKIDVYSRNAKQYMEQVSDEALASFEYNTKIKLTREQFADFKAMISGIKDIVEKYGSDNIAKMYDEMNKKGGSNASLTLGAILREVYGNMPEGTSKNDLLNNAYTYIEMLFGEND